MPDEPQSPEPNNTAPENPSLPRETLHFVETKIEQQTVSFTADEWRSALRSAEVRDKQQQIMLRPYFAIGVFLLLAAQNAGIWFLVVWAMQTSALQQLQIIFGALVAGSLTQSYFILRLITKKVFDDIDYHNGDHTV
jgi:hypothetical protein